jgi:hypothetical protein
MTRIIAALAASVVLLCGCQANVSAETVLAGRIVPGTKGTPLSGTFVVENGCVHAQMQEGGKTYPVIWPEGSEISPEDPTRVTLLNGSVSLSEAPKDFEIVYVKTESITERAQRGEIAGWDQCSTEANESVLVVTAVGGISLPD